MATNRRTSAMPGLASKASNDLAEIAKAANAAPQRPQKQPTASSGSGNVRVYCRFRPLNSKEKAMGETGNSVANFVDKKTLEVNGIKPDGSMGKVKYNFDRCFPSDTT